MSSLRHDAIVYASITEEFAKRTAALTESGPALTTMITGSGQRSSAYREHAQAVLDAAAGSAEVAKASSDLRSTIERVRASGAEMSEQGRALLGAQLDSIIGELDAIESAPVHVEGTYAGMLRRTSGNEGSAPALSQASAIAHGSVMFPGLILGPVLTFGSENVNGGSGAVITAGAIATALGIGTAAKVRKEAFSFSGTAAEYVGHLDRMSTAAFRDGEKLGRWEVGAVPTRRFVGDGIPKLHDAATRQASAASALASGIEHRISSAYEEGADVSVRPAMFEEMRVGATTRAAEVAAAHREGARAVDGLGQHSGPLAITSAADEVAPLAALRPEALPAPEPVRVTG